MRAYRKFFREADEKTNGKVFQHLEAIMRGWRHVGSFEFQMTIDWDDFDFKHIPVGVLSQVYESFSRRWDVIQAEETSVHYTPKNIARLLVEEALAGVKDPEDALVLDPACGAGIFLVLAFRQLVRLHWKKEGQRPDKNIINRILYKQIRGFDISESALRLAALALYITAIEVNGTTRPPKILKFPRALKDEVLFNFGPPNTDERRHGFVLGSLASIVPERFNAQFDVVVGNPPWTRLRPPKTEEARKNKKEIKARNRAINQQFTVISRRALAARKIEGFDVKAYTNPDNNPDLPFLWRAAEWAKPGGVIAMALPARIILKQSAKGNAAREALESGRK
jgi:type I restriction-modification system DNA methylase subunit